MLKKILLAVILTTVILFVVIVGYNIVFLIANPLTNSAPWYVPLLYPGIIFYAILLTEIIIYFIIKK